MMRGTSWYAANGSDSSMRHYTPSVIASDALVSVGGVSVYNSDESDETVYHALILFPHKDKEKRRKR